MLLCFVGLFTNGLMHMLLLSAKVCIMGKSEPPQAPGSAVPAPLSFGTVSWLTSISSVVLRERRRFQTNLALIQQLSHETVVNPKEKLPLHSPDYLDITTTTSRSSILRSPVSNPFFLFPLQEVFLKPQASLRSAACTGRARAQQTGGLWGTPREGDRQVDWPRHSLSDVISVYFIYGLIVRRTLIRRR